MSAVKFIIGVVAVLGASSGAVYLLDRQRVDAGGQTPAQVEAQRQQPTHDQMRVVIGQEADRRATVTRQEAEAARLRERSFDGQAVITQRTGPEQGEMLPPPTPPTPPTPPEPRIEYRDRIVTQQVPVYIDRPFVVPQQVVAEDDGVHRARMNQQIDTLVQTSNPGFVVRTTQAPEKPPAVAAAVAGQSGVQQRPIVRTRLVARTGDVIYGLLDRGFNSDDPNAPLIITLYDVLQDGRQGPLTGARLIGQIQYSQNSYSPQSAVVFSRLVMVDGRETQIQALAISETDARTGIAANVDYHTLSRWSALLAGTLIQGAGTVGTQLVQNNSTTTLNGNFAVVSGNPVNYWQTAMAALQPLGQAASQAAQNYFQRPPTLSAPQGMGVGVVFLQPVVLPY